MGSVLLTNLGCTGVERNLSECSHSAFGVVSSLCKTHFYDASVFCPTGVSVFKFSLFYIELFMVIQNAQITNSRAVMVVLIVNCHHVYQLTNVVMVSMTVLEEKMNWITTVPVDQREQFV